MHQLRERWRDRANQLSFTLDDAAALTDRATITPLTPAASDDCQHELASQTGLTQRRSSFMRRDAVRAWCEQLPHGGRRV